MSSLGVDAADLGVADGDLTQVGMLAGLFVGSFGLCLVVLLLVRCLRKPRFAEHEKTRFERVGVDDDVDGPDEPDDDGDEAPSRVSIARPAKSRSATTRAVDPTLVVESLDWD